MRLRRPSGWFSYGRHLLLFAITVASIYGTGARADGRGMALVLAVCAILLAHEMGHYVACRYYKVDATLPFFLPSPWIPLGPGLQLTPLSFVGTLGAVIAIRSPFPHRRAIFDIGIAGPLAGFAVCLPVLVLGVLEARVVSAATVSSEGLALGAPLLFHWIASGLRNDVLAGMTLSLGPLGVAAWFGLLVTALNLMPVGQLDGGHVLYALFGRRAHALSRLFWWASLTLIWISPSWVVWAVLMRVVGRNHPPSLHDALPLGPARIGVAIVGLIVFAVSFTPEPIVASWDMLFEDLRTLAAWAGPLT